MIAPPSSEFNNLLPFHLVVDRGLRLVQTGSAIADCLSDFFGQPIGQNFQIERPAKADFAFEQFADIRNSLWIISAANGLRLRGSWRIYDSQHAFFLASIWAIDLTELTEIGLDAAQFPLHDSFTDQLILLQQQRSSLDDAMRISKKLKERNLELSSARDRANEASNAKSQFLAAMSHEIRTPMNGILGMTQIIKDSEMDETTQERVGIIERSATSLLYIINDILDFSKIEAGKFSLTHTSFSLAKCIEDQITLLHPMADEKNVRLELETAVDDSTYVQGDGIRLGQVLTNLIGNAIKFTMQGNIQLKVTKRAAQRWKFSVQDTGIGMKSVELEKIFMPFCQADQSLNTKTTGTGLGLSIAQQLINLMGGEIFVASNPGEGSVFWFEIDLPSSVKHSQAANQAGDRLNFESKILLVEDNLINQKVATAFLERVGVIPDIAENGQQALEHLANNVDSPYDLILMDCQMPVLDGIETSRQIRAGAVPGFETIPIIALTANVMPESIKQCHAVGMNDVIGKPFSGDKFYNALERWL